MTDWQSLLSGAKARFGPGATGGRVLDFGSPAAEVAAGRTGAIAVPLDLVPVAIGGPDATAFLHGQFTCDVQHMEPGQVQYGAWCSAKGRVLASFPLARTGAADYLLLAPSELAAPLEKRLRMYVLRAKVTVQAQGATHTCIGVGGPGAEAATPGPGRGRADRVDEIWRIGLPDPAGPARWIAVAELAQAARTWSGLAGKLTAAGAPAWDALAIAAGVPVIGAAVQDRFVPQMLNWELVGGVSFNKGCYPGQEIVARMQYLGRLKERLRRVHVDGADPVAAGDPVHGTAFGEQACGTVIMAAPAPGGGWDALAVLQIAAEGDPLRLGAALPGRLVTLDVLPYAVPRAADR